MIVKYLRRILLSLVQRRPYADPQSVGYAASIHAPILGCIAFERLDGALITEW
jgi:hypothetical protein